MKYVHTPAVSPSKPAYYALFDQTFLNGAWVSKDIRDAEDMSRLASNGGSGEERPRDEFNASVAAAKRAYDMRVGTTTVAVDEAALAEAIVRLLPAGATKADVDAAVATIVAAIPTTFKATA